MLKNGKTLIPKQENLLEILKTLCYKQQLYMYQNHTHQVDKPNSCHFTSSSKPDCTGKNQKQTAKIDIRLSDGFVRLEQAVI